MSYRIEAGEPVEDALRRIAFEQIAKARSDLEDDDPRRAVHEVRKRCKKLRALLRLVRPAMEGTYQRENAHLRDAARELSDLRDATSLIESFDALMKRFEEEIDPDAYAWVREALLERRAKREAIQDVGSRLEEMDEALKETRERVDDWSLDGDGGAAAVRGAGRTYGRARKAMHRALEEPTDENLHAWRKRVKYHRYHVRLLAPLWEPVAPALRESAHLLSDRLGDHHDLAVLRATLLDESDRFGPARALEPLLALVDARRLELRVWSLPLGERHHADGKKRWRKRMERWWRAAKHEIELARALPEAASAVYS